MHERKDNGTDIAGCWARNGARGGGLTVKINHACNVVVSRSIVSTLTPFIVSLFFPSFSLRRLTGFAFDPHGFSFSWWPASERANQVRSSPVRTQSTVHERQKAHIISHRERDRVKQKLVSLGKTIEGVLRPGKERQRRVEMVNARASERARAVTRVGEKQEGEKEKVEPPRRATP